VILDAARVWVKAIRARSPLPSTEAEAVPSRILAPAGLFWSPEERALLGDAGASGGNGAIPAGPSRFTRERDKTGSRAP